MFRSHHLTNRNRPGGNFNDSLVFNNIISHLGLINLPIKGRSYTWSNKQECPLLGRLIGFLLLCPGPLLSPHHWYYPLLESLLIMCPAKLRLAQISLRPTSSGLKILAQAPQLYGSD
jgi:hypothetical protein